MPLAPVEVLRKVPLFSGLGESDLSAFAGRHATVSLSVVGEPGTVGVWGAPVVRSRAAATASGSHPQGVIWIPLASRRGINAGWS